MALLSTGFSWLGEELWRFLRQMGEVEDGAGPLSEASRPLHGLHKGAGQ